MTSQIKWYCCLLVVLTGCAGKPIQPQTGPLPVVILPGQSIESGAAEKADVLYRLLLAEIAGQRGYFDISIDNLMAIAKQVRDPRVAERATRAAIFAKEYPQAFEAARLWVELDPQRAEAHQVAAALALRQSKVDIAIDYFQQVLLLDPKGIEQGFLVVASLLSREGKQHSEAALSVMGELVEAHEDNAFAYFAYGNLAMLLGEHAIAESKLRQALRLKPDLSRAIILHARAMRALGEIEAAISQLATAVEKYPEDNNLLLAYSRILLNAKRYPEAKVQFEALLEKSPENSDLMYTLALLSLDMDLHDEAAGHLNQLLKLNKRVFESHYYLGRIHEMRRRFPEAIEAYRRVKQGEYRLDAEVRVAQSLARLERIDEARQHLKNLRLKTTEPATRVRYYLVETDVLSVADDYQGAVDLLSSALNAIPGDTDLLYTRGLLYEKLDRLDLLENDLHAVLLREPENADALNALGYTLADRTDRYQEAYELIKQAITLKPDSASITDSMGWVLYRLGRLDEALEYLQRALSLNYDAEIAAHLGEVLWVTGDHRGAEAVIKQALEKTPDDEHLNQMIEQLKSEQSSPQAIR